MFLPSPKWYFCEMTERLLIPIMVIITQYISVHQINTLYTLNLCDVIYQFYHNEAEKNIMDFCSYLRY